MKRSREEGTGQKWTRVETSFYFFFTKKPKCYGVLYDEKNEELTHECLIARQPKKYLTIFFTLNTTLLLK